MPEQIEVGQEADLFIRGLEGEPTVAISVTAIDGDEYNVEEVVETLRAEHGAEVRR